MKATVILRKEKKIIRNGIETNECMLYLRLTDGSKRKRISLNVSLPENRWDFKKNEYIPIPITRGMSDEKKAEAEKQNARIRNLISETLSKYNKAIRELAVDGKRVSLDTLHLMIDKPVNKEHTVFSWFESLIEDFKTEDKLGQVNVYTYSYHVFKEFLRGKDITFSEIDLPMLERYYRFLNQRRRTIKSSDKKEVTTVAIKTASISIYLRTLRAAISKAVRMGYAKENPFTGFKIPTGKPNKRALSSQEMESLLNHKTINKDTDNYRMLVFSYYTIGMNFTDLARLTWRNVRGNEIHYTRKKINHKIIIPIHPKVKEVLDYYRPKTGNTPSISGLNENYVFPILYRGVHDSEQQKANRIKKMCKEFNKFLKTAGALAGVEIPLTSYVLRHTAITNLVRAGVTADAIQALAGHKKLTTTETYIKEASQEQKTKAVNML